MSLIFNYQKVKEIWKDIIGYEGLYQVSNLGRIFSPKRRGSPGCIRKFHTNEDGYCKVGLRVNWKERKFSVHRLVAEAFIPNLKNKLEINHKNGVKADNHVDNLEWVTSSENAIHAYKFGLRKGPKGELNGKSKLSEFQIKRIRLIKEIQPNMREIDLAKIFKVSRSLIGQIVRKEAWSHIT